MNKQEVKQLVIDTLQHKIAGLHQQIDMLANDAQNDAKSSAGDKHETSLSMMHLEQEKLTAKLKENYNLLDEVVKLPTEISTEKVSLGSIVITDKAIFYISVALQPVVYQNKTILCVSTKAPLIQNMLSKKISDIITFNCLSYEILQII